MKDIYNLWFLVYMFAFKLFTYSIYLLYNIIIDSGFSEFGSDSYYSSILRLFLCQRVSIQH